MTTEPVSLLHEFNENNVSEKNKAPVKKEKTAPKEAVF
jgi:hypothetical protein